MRKVEEEIDFIDKSIPKEAIDAADLYVSFYIDYNGGYEPHIIVLDSKLFSLTNAGEGNIDSMIDIEIAYFYCFVEHIEQGIFDNYFFQAETVRASQSELIKSGGRSSPPGNITYADPDVFTVMEFNEVTRIELVKRYESQINSKHLEDNVFSFIIDDWRLSEAVFCFEDIDDDMDLRDLYGAAQKTLLALSEGSFDPTSDSEWWSDLYSIDESNQDMFQRIPGGGF